VTVAPVTANLAGVSLPKWVVRPMSLVAPVGRPPEAPHDPPAINPRPIHAAARAMPRAGVAGTLLVNEPEALIPCELFLEVSCIDQQFRNSEGHAGHITAPYRHLPVTESVVLPPDVRGLHHDQEKNY
jgi:hypothetical protein